ncbi:MAG: hypothetical protein Tsb0017_02720 [Geothermobacteraceae bacterium]
MRVFLLKAGGLDLALEAGRVDRVVEMPPLFRLPQVPEPFAGVCLVDDKPVAVFEPGTPGRPGGESGYLMIVLSRSGVIGLPVSDVPTVLAANRGEVDTDDEPAADWQAGWVVSRGSRWPLIDIDRLIPAQCM